MSWVTSWESWRKTMGPRGSRHRTAVDAFLQSHPAIMYWGDSWFSTPLYLNLARQSSLRINGAGILIGKPGAEAAELFRPSEVARIIDRLLGSPFDVLCLSAGGNDCLGDRLAVAFKAWKHDPTKPKISAADAFTIVEQAGTFERIFGAYDRLLTSLARVKDARGTFRVVGHPYVPIQHIGLEADLTVANIGLVAWLKGEVGPWLWTPMRHVLKDGKAGGKEFADRLLVAGFRRDVLDRLATKHAGLFSVADFAAVDLTTDGFWNDEIHPSEQGFGELARAFNAEIRKQLPLAKRAAVA